MDLFPFPSIEMGGGGVLSQLGALEKDSLKHWTGEVFLSIVNKVLPLFINWPN